MDKQKFSHGARFDFSHQVTIQDNPLNHFLPDKYECDGTEVVFRRSDVQFIFDQQKIAKIAGDDVVRDWLSHLGTNARNGVDTSGLTDEQLSTLIPSRYCQTLSERSRWYDYLESRKSELLGKINTLKRHQRQTEEQQTEKTKKSE